MLDRRTFLKGLAAAATGLLLPSPDLVAGEEAVKRYWALGGLPEQPSYGIEDWRRAYGLWQDKVLEDTINWRELTTSFPVREGEVYSLAGHLHAVTRVRPMDGPYFRSFIRRLDE
jgi:hypothetical protein